jgi:CubicO group peptidase (beta-lactamase class C family)
MGMDVESLDPRAGDKGNPPMKPVAWVRLLLACALLSCAPPGRSAAEPVPDLSGRVDRLVQKHIKPDGPGAAVLVVYHGEVVHSKGYGLANLRKQSLVTPQTVFDLASVSKQFTAMAVLILHERGKLQLDDNVRKYLPELRPHKPGRPIRISDLLHHTSGLPEYVDLVDTAKATNEDVLKVIARRPLAHPTGTKHDYCNTGYALAALVVERASGKPFPEFLGDEVFGPLQLQHTSVCAGPPRGPNRAHGYSKSDDGKLEPAHGESPIYGDGSVFTTLEDMARWDSGLRTNKLVKAETLRLAWTPGRLDNGERFDYGFGWAIERTDGKLVVWHNGEWGGFTSYICRHVDDDLTVVVLTNRDGHDPAKIGDAIAELYLRRAK